MTVLIFGILIRALQWGDPTDGCISILITRDAGRQWSKIPCSHLSKIVEGEAAFAASDTNISIFDDKVWLASGGAVSRILIRKIKELQGVFLTHQ